MPVLADIRCRACSAVFEAMVKNDGSANPSCPTCGHADTQRLIGTPRLLYARMAADGTASSDAMTTSIDRWQKGREQKMRTEDRNLERHGTYD